jgi:hypothetical protein
MQLADELATACGRLKLPVRWTQQEGEPVALVELHSDASPSSHQFHIESIELGDSELYVSGHTRLGADKQSARPANAGSRTDTVCEVTLDDYELRLTPRHKRGALQIARRTDPDEKAPKTTNQ